MSVFGEVWLKIIEGNIYDYLKYYDLIFGLDWKVEFNFLELCFDKYFNGCKECFFELVCGMGRLIYCFVKEGYEVSGLDFNLRVVDYCNVWLYCGGFELIVFVGDMIDFKLCGKCDVVFNIINSFCYLIIEK